MADDKKVLSATELLAFTNLPTEKFDIPAFGGSIVIRGLRKSEQMDLRKKAARADGTFDETALEIGMLAAGIEEPKFTEEQISQLAHLSAGVYDSILLRIAEMSGVGANSLKAAEKTFRP
jgi:hypothetical protein